LRTDRTATAIPPHPAHGRSWKAGVGIGILAGGIALVLVYATSLLSGMENVCWAWRAKAMAKPTTTTAQIKIITIDNASLQWVEKQTGVAWPWPRELYGYLLSYFSRAGIHNFTADLLFEQAQSVAGDAAFADAIRQGPPFIAAFSLSDNTGSQAELPDSLSRFFPALSDETLRTLPNDFTIATTQQYARLPIPELWQPIRGLGNVTVEPDPDGVIRRVPLLRLYRKNLIPSLALASVTMGEAFSLNATSGRIILTLPSISRVVPLDEHSDIILRYRGPAQTYQTISAAAILQSEMQLREGKRPQVDPERFQGARIILGISATGGTGGFDLKPTPVARTMCGAEINATVIDNLIQGDWLTTPSAFPVILAVLLTTGLAGLLCVRFSKPWQNLLLLPATLAALWLAGLFLYDHGLWWPVAGHGVGLSFTVLFMIVFHYATEGRRRRFIQNAFMHYLSPQVIADLMAHPEQLRLGGQRRNLTIFFSDLQGFTSISERLEPEQLTQLLNEYLTEMTEIILDCGGTLDKYEGDAIIAFWNAPVAQPDHAERGVSAALLCQQKLSERRDDWKKRFAADLHMRIGLHTGDAIVGNMGSGRRFDYTMLGDAPNLASRLEGVNKVFGTSILASESTWASTQTRFHYHRVGRIYVVGRKAPVDTYAPYGFPEQERNSAFDAVGRAIDSCLSQQCAESIPIFTQHQSLPLAQAYLQKIATSPSTWDGIWHLNEK